MNQHQKNKLVKAAFNYLSQLKEEHQIIVYFNDDETVQLVDITGSHSIEHVDFSMEKLINLIDLLQEKEIYTAHNHPSRSIQPSMSDYVATDYFNSLLRLSNIILKGELIVTKEEVISYSVPRENSFSFFEEPISMPIFGEKPEIYSVPLKKHDKKTIEALIYPHLEKNYEVICTESALNISEHFSFHDFMRITNNIQDILIFGVPNYRTQQQWERIQDIEKVFGSIEFYSTKARNQSAIALKEKLIL